MSIIWTFNQIENKRTLYHGKYSMENFRKYLRKQAKNIIDLEKKRCYH